MMIKSRYLVSFFRKIIFSNRCALLHKETNSRLIFSHYSPFENFLLKPMRFSSSLPPHNFANLPSLSPTMETGNITSWLKKEGDKLEEGDTLCQIETDKAVMDVETPHTGFLARILYPEGTKKIQINKPIAIIVKKYEDIPLFKEFKVDEQAVKQPAKEQSKPVETTSTQASSSLEKDNVKTQISPSTAKNRIFASPFAKKLAKEAGISLSEKIGSGPKGRILASDITTNSQTQLFTDIEITSMRATIAKRLLFSKTSIPHFHVSQNIDVGPLLKLRSDLNLHFNGRIKLSINDFIIKAASLTLVNIPECNSHWMESFIRQFNSVDISIAVATESGLITPIIFNASDKSLSSINAEMGILAEKARNNRLKPQEFQGGTFTISNLGMYGIKSFTAIINPPQSCILSVGGFQKLYLPDSSNKKCDSSVNVPCHLKTFMTATLGCDHRVVDGVIGAKWLNKFKEYIENPYSMLI